MTPAEIRKQLVGKPKRRAKPYDRMTKAQMWSELETLRKRVDSAAAMTNDIGRDLRRLPPSFTSARLTDISDRAYAVRDHLRGDKP